MRNEVQFRRSRSFNELDLTIAVFVLCLVFLGTNRPVAAGQDEDAAWGHFDIPAQPLASALTIYGTRTRVALFVDTNLVTGRHSVALKGVFTTEAGLQSLLIGTGLVAIPVGSGFAITKAGALGTEPTRSAPPSSAIALAFASYSALLQEKLKRALCAREETRPGDYRTLIRLWIDSEGSMANVQLLTSTGDPKRDNLLYLALRGLSLDEPPPADLPQPVTFLLAPGGGNAAQYCASASTHRLYPVADSERSR